MLDQDWVKYLENVVESMNQTPLQKLGYLKPVDISSQFDTVIVKSNKKHLNIPIYSPPNFKIQEENQKNYEKTSDLQLNDFVYLDLDEKLFDKSYDVSVSTLN